MAQATSAAAKKEKSPVSFASRTGRLVGFLNTPTGQRAAVLAVLLLGLLVRLWMVADWNSYRPDSPARLIGDEPGYDNLAREFLAGYGFTWPGRVPFYPIWLAAVYLLTNGSYAQALYWQIIPGLLTILLTYLLGRRLLGHAVGVLAALGAAVSYTLVHQTVHYLSEIWFTPLLLAVLLALNAALARPSWKRFIFAGFLLGISNLVRPTLLFFPFFALPLLRVKLSSRKWLGWGAVYIAAGLLTVTPWLVHNYLRYDVWFPLQTSNAILWQGSPEYYRLIHDEGYTYLQIWTEVLYGPGWEGRDPNSVSGDRYWTERALQSIRAEPYIYLLYAVEKTGTFWVGDPNADWNNTYIFNVRALRDTGFTRVGAVSVMLMRALPLLAVWAIWRLRRQWRRLLPLYTLLLFATLLHAATHAEARLSEPFQPLLLVLIAGALWPLIQIATRRLYTARRSTAVGSGADQ